MLYVLVLFGQTTVGPEIVPGCAGVVVNDTSFPYEVEMLLVAYALTKYVVLAASPVRLLTNVPTPPPSLVCMSAVVGFDTVLQQTPLSVTEAPPSLTTVPPLIAVETVMPVIVAVVTVAEASARRQRSVSASDLLVLPKPQYPLRKFKSQPIVALPCKVLQYKPSVPRLPTEPSAASNLPAA